MNWNLLAGYRIYHILHVNVRITWILEGLLLTKRPNKSFDRIPSDHHTCYVVPIKKKPGYHGFVMLRYFI